MPTFNPRDYVDVQERIVRFWSEHPDGAIVTRLMSPPDDFERCRYEASVYKHREDQRPSATGYAFELAGGRGANATSHEENGETSSVGRALANMGYAKTRDDRPSAQEMGKVARGAQTESSSAPSTESPPSVPSRGAQAHGGASGGTTEPAEPPPSTITPDQRRRLEGMVKERGGDHAMLRDIGQALFLKGTTTAWTAEEGDRVSRWIGPYDATGWGIAWEYARKLLQAETTDALSAVANEMGAAGVSDHELRAIYKRKKESFTQPAGAGQFAGMPAPTDRPGDDKYTQ